MRLLRLIAVFFTVLVAAASGLHAQTLKIVATTPMIADAAIQVGGGHVEVKALMGPGVDPHSYRQTRSDIVAMMKADLVLWHGLYLEAQMEDFLGKLASRKTVVPVAEKASGLALLSHDNYPDRVDPHVWMDPELWKSVVSAVHDELIALYPEGKADFDANATAHLAEVEQLAAYSRSALASVPKGNRVLVTAHDAFNYFGRAYSFEVIGIQGISTESEAGINRISELVDMLTERRIGAIFVESSVSERNIKALIEGAAAKGHDVAIGGELFSDAMGTSGSYEGTYIGMIDHNVTVIARALGGDAPNDGYQGRLAAGS